MLTLLDNGLQVFQGEDHGEADGSPDYRSKTIALSDSELMQN